MEQMQLTLWRSWVMLKNDPTITFTLLITNLFEGLIVSSLFYNLPPDTSSMERRALLLFFVIIINAFSSILEILTLYAKRRIVEKQSRYAMYHRSAEALSAMIVDLPYKIVNAILLNLTVYIMANLRRESGKFFFFLLISFFTTMTMSMMFRFIGSVTKSVAQALAPASIILLVVALYAGFVIPPQYMQVWLGWVRWLNPAFYGLESVLINEFVGRNFECLQYVPNGPRYESVDPASRACSAPGAEPGQNFVDGAAFVQASYGFETTHRWRNFGILIALMIFFMILHLIATEYILSERSNGEVLSFRRKTMLRLRKQNALDTETGAIQRANRGVTDSDNESEPGIEKQTAVFHWKDVCYDVKVKDQNRRILDHVDGWVKPGTLTALMVSRTVLFYRR
jgi:ABC-type multidrug transport system permease subunit